MAKGFMPADTGNVRAPWKVDGDNWVTRPVRGSDPPKSAFANSVNAFIMRGRLYCRNAEQAAILDAGGVV